MAAMPAGNVENGAKLFKQRCLQCHTTTPDMAAKTGPGLFGIVGRAAGTVAGYDYTKANKDSGITWTEEALFGYLEDPKKRIPGTKMNFAGFKKAQERADVVAYLATLK
eukprot:a846125_931.p2 GENE.a846125_931~~a846125_931.p2  ORF type:complete len:120 (-),score=59.41 a846125_931:48-374(-)